MGPGKKASVRAAAPSAKAVPGTKRAPGTKAAPGTKLAPGKQTARGKQMVPGKQPAPDTKTALRKPVPAPATALASAYAGLDLLPSAVLLADAQFRVVHANSAAENLFETSLRSLIGRRVTEVLPDQALDAMLSEVVDQEWSHRTQEIEVAPPGRTPILVACVVTPAHQPPVRVLLELQVIDQRLRVSREERIAEQAGANRELIRNLAHEIKNPLGGIRGAAQLLERELPSAALREYTQVIVKESDRLQALLDRLLTPHRPPRIAAVNIHEVLERVRSLLAAEFPGQIRLIRDYDTSLPELRGDVEQLIQVVLNVARNAAQALRGTNTPQPQIRLKTRAARQVTLHKERFRLALDLHVEDNGPGIPAAIRERIFYPLVSGREGGSGLGLTLAQSFVLQHRGVIECDSRPGLTVFRILLPLG